MNKKNNLIYKLYILCSRHYWLPTPSISLPFLPSSRHNYNVILLFTHFPWVHVTQGRLVPLPPKELKPVWTKPIMTVLLPCLGLVQTSTWRNLDKRGSLPGWGAFGSLLLFSRLTEIDVLSLDIVGSGCNAQKCYRRHAVSLKTSCTTEEGKKEKMTKRQSQSHVNQHLELALPLDFSLRELIILVCFKPTWIPFTDTWYIYWYVNVCVCVCVYTYVYVCICIYLHICI